MVDGFTAEKTTFSGKRGYMVRQYRGGVVILSQFVELSAYADFCDWIGTRPEITGESEVKA